MQETLYQIADAMVYQTADSGILYQTTDAGDFLSDSGCMRHYIRQWMQAYLHQTADA